MQALISSVKTRIPTKSFFLECGAIVNIEDILITISDETLSSKPDQKLYNTVKKYNMHCQFSTVTGELEIINPALDMTPAKSIRKLLLTKHTIYMYTAEELRNMQRWCHKIVGFSRKYQRHANEE